MLINCPKCGFSQPQDKYCARCGIDVETYKPSRDPWWVRLYKNALGQFLIFALIFGAGASYYLKFKSSHSQNNFAEVGADYSRREPTQANVTDTAATEDSQAQLAVSAPTSNEAASENAPIEAEFASESLNPPIETKQGSANAGPDQMANAVTQGVDAETAAREEMADPNASPSFASGGRNTSHTLQVHWVEMRDDYLEQLIRESRARTPVQNFGNYRTGTLTETEKFLKATNSNIKIHLREDKTLEIAKSQQWFLGKRGQTPEQDLGLEVYIELLDSGGGAFKGNLLVARSWRPEGTDVRGPANEKFSFPAIFDVRGKEAFFMANLLPRSANPDPAEGSLALISPFEILKSSNFRNTLADLVLILTFDK